MKRYLTIMLTMLALSVPALSQSEQIAQQIQQQASVEQQDDDYILHRVKWYENIYTIASKYDIEALSIVKYNKLSSTRLTVGQLIKIPKAAYLHAVEDEKPDVVEATEEEDLEELLKKEQEKGHSKVQEHDDDTDLQKSDASLFRFPKRKKPLYSFDGKVKAALVLPFNANGDAPSVNYLDFYSGFLLAIKQAKEDGIDINLTVRDTYDLYNSRSLELKDELGNADFIVGPVSVEDLETMLELSDSKSIPLISPMDQKAENLVDGNPYFIQVPTSDKVQIHNLVESIDFDYQNDVCIVIYETGNQTSIYDNLCAELEDRHINYKSVNYGILGGREIGNSLKKMLTENGTNHIVLASEKEAFASDAVRNMSLLAIDEKGYNIIGYASHKLRNFQTIENEDFQNVCMHFSMGYYVDYSSQATKDFVLQYRALFGAEPSPFAFQGYDIATYFVTACKKFGNSFIDYLPQFDMKLLQSEMLFFKTESGGFYNGATRNIIYRQDYIIECN